MARPDGRVLYWWAQTTGYLYQAEPRARLTETLGLSWTEVRKGVAGVQDVTAAQRDASSTRRAQIRAELERVGQASPAAARTATLASRDAKDRSLGLDELRARWTLQAREVGLDVKDLLHPARSKTIGPASPRNGSSPRCSPNAAVSPPKRSLWSSG